MKQFLRLYHFLGSVYFAIILIATTALLVIIGTFIESATQSHQSAAFFTYDSPLFMLLITGFFLNILISALRRWPFRKRHIPFLITHLGLLMILAGVMVKSVFGLQGTLMVMEGSSTQDLLIGNKEALRVEHRESGKVAYIPLHQQIPGIHFKIAKRVENSQEKLTPWFHGNTAIIRGLDPLPVYTITRIHEKLPPCGHIRFFSDHPTYCHVYALKTKDPEEAIQSIYQNQAIIKITETSTQKPLGKRSLNEMLAGSFPISLSNGNRIALRTDLNISFHPSTSAQLRFYLDQSGHESEVEIPLHGPKALLNLNQTTPHLGALPVTFDIEMSPILALIDDTKLHRTITFASDPHGLIWNSIDHAATIDQVFAYDEGFAGYSMQKTLPWHSHSYGRKEREEALHHLICMAAEESIENAEPLKQFKNACETTKSPFGLSFVHFLSIWNTHNSWLYPTTAQLPDSLNPLFQQLGSQFSEIEWEASFLSSLLFSIYDPLLQTGIDPIHVLTKEQWPLATSIKHALSQNPKNEEHPQQALTLLTQQIIGAAHQLPPKNPKIKSLQTAEEAASAFSTYLRAYGIHLNTLTPTLSLQEFQTILDEKSMQTNQKSLVLETPIRKGFIEKPPLTKWEDNIPAITLLAKTAHGTEAIDLTYDKKGSGLCWPCGQGEYLIRFQPMVVSIPYQIRLRQARHISYPDSTQPYSFEADLIIKDERTGELVEKTISMNHVHETHDHYRFYLSALYPPGEGTVKTVQIVVNKDPAKYWLTYPGAFILSMGVILLFLMKYKESKKR